MKKYFIFLFFLLLLITSSCKKDDTDNAICYTNVNAQSITHDQLDREYIIYIPQSYNGTENVPLLINFHGYGGSASNYMINADMRSLAELNNFILVYPQGSCLDGSSHWNACPNGGDNKSNADDFGFVEALINKISSEYSIDLERIYAAGYSNGGMMAYGLANYKSELIAAVASVSGTMLDCTGTTSHPMPVIHFHGTADSVIPYNGNNFFNSAQNVLNHWINFNNSNSTPIVNSETNNGITIEHFSYNQGNNSVSVEHYKYINEEHVWFTIPYQGKNTSKLIWDFVSQYDLNGLR